MSATACSAAPAEQYPASKVRPLQFPPVFHAGAQWLCHALALRNTPLTSIHKLAVITGTDHFCSQWLLIKWVFQKWRIQTKSKFGMSWNEDYPGFAEPLDFPKSEAPLWQRPR